MAGHLARPGWAFLKLRIWNEIVKEGKKKKKKKQKQTKKKTEDVAYRPGDGNLVGLLFSTLSPHYHLFCCVIGWAGHSIF